MRKMVKPNTTPFFKSSNHKVIALQHQRLGKIWGKGSSGGGGGGAVSLTWMLYEASNRRTASELTENAAKELESLYRTSSFGDSSSFASNLPKLLMLQHQPLVLLDLMKEMHWIWLKKETVYKLIATTTNSSPIYTLITWVTSIIKCYSFKNGSSKFG